ncbi:hypothetical protein [Frankia sp. EAN1pec]|uniref:hypothetical protein n=1 Tax=Parafrankia sp. (strain EAN1pec) TaxID=298653 RepID=UPI0018DC8BA6
MALADVAGSEGHVLAVDRDVRFLDDLPDGVEVRCMDVMVDDLPHAQFDLVHARLLVAHLHPHQGRRSPSSRRIRRLTHRFVVDRLVLFGEDLGRDDRSCMGSPAR